MMKKITEFPAVIWDFDGVIVDSEKLWQKHAPVFYHQICPDFESEDIKQFVGGSLKNAWGIFSKKYGLKISYPKFKKSCEDFALENMYPLAKLSPNVKQCFEKLHKNNVPQAIASSGTHRWIDPTIERFGINNFFAEIISSDDTDGRGKPFPDVFLLAAKKLGVNPAKSLIIEDSNNGVRAGKTAGATVYGYQNGYNHTQDLSEADFLFSDFLEIL
jgi:HAD superfamily hydrolase (TIGR01509 family)